MPAKSLTPGRARVLLLQDGPVVEATLAEGLRAESYELLVGSDRHQAIGTFRAGDIDSLVIDLEIPSEELEQLVAMLNDGEPLGHSLVIVRSLEQLILASEAGAEIVLIKPLESNLIGRVMDYLLLGRGRRLRTKGGAW
jgi:DNA-binding response OmpR family regulator